MFVIPTEFYIGGSLYEFRCSFSLTVGEKHYSLVADLFSVLFVLLSDPATRLRGCAVSSILKELMQRNVVKQLPIGSGRQKHAPFNASICILGPQTEARSVLV